MVNIGILLYIFLFCLGLLFLTIGLMIWKPHWFGNDDITSKEYRRLYKISTEGFLNKTKKEEKDPYEGWPKSDPYLKVAREEVSTFRKKNL